MQNKTICKKVLRDLQGLAESKNNSILADLISETIKRLDEEVFTLVVLGEFKRGKSTFINSLLEKSVVPTGVVPLTAIPTLIKYGEKERAEIIFRDGGRKEVDIGHLIDYVTEKGNPRNEKGVKEVIICLPSELLSLGVVLVDTPGIGSIYQHNTDVAYSYLPKADAVIFVFSADSPLSKNEAEFLKSIRTNVKELFFVLNKIDLLSDWELQEMLCFLRQSLKTDLAFEDINIYPVSSRLALRAKIDNDEKLLEESGILVLENDLYDFIRDKKERIIIDKAIDRAFKSIQELEFCINLQERSLNLSIEELSEKIRLCEDEEERLRQELENVVYILNKEVDKFSLVISDDIKDFYRQNTSKLLVDLEKHYFEISNKKLSNKEMLECLNSFINSSIMNLLNEWRVKESQKILEMLYDAIRKTCIRVNDIVNELYNKISIIFELPTEKLRITDSYFIEMERFYYNFNPDYGFIPSFEAIASSNILPKIFFKNLLLNQLKKKMMEMFDKNCGRVRYDMTYNLRQYTNEIIRDLRRNVEIIIDGVRNTIYDMLDKKQSQTVEKEKMIKIYEEEKNKLVLLKDRLMKIWG